MNRNHEGKEGDCGGEEKKQAIKRHVSFVGRHPTKEAQANGQSIRQVEQLIIILGRPSQKNVPAASGRPRRPCGTRRGCVLRDLEARHGDQPPGLAEQCVPHIQIGEGCLVCVDGRQTQIRA